MGSRSTTRCSLSSYTIRETDHTGSGDRGERQVYAQPRAGVRDLEVAQAATVADLLERHEARARGAPGPSVSAWWCAIRSKSGGLLCVWPTCLRWSPASKIVGVFSETADAPRLATKVRAAIRRLGRRVNRVAPAPPIRPLHSTDPAGGVFVGASQPLAQPTGGLARGRSIKGHQRGRDLGNPDDSRAPAIGRDRGDLDHVRVAADEFFEAMDSYAHGRGGCVCLGG